MVNPYAALSGGSSINGGDAGPSSAGVSGATGDLGLSVGDYYGRGSRVRKAEGLDWKTIAAVGVVGLVALKVMKS